MEELRPEEPICFQLLRSNVLRHLYSTVELKMEHKMATVLHPSYRNLRMLPPDERNQVMSLCYHFVILL